MPRFKSRSSKIQPYCGSDGVNDALLFTKVKPNLPDVFGKTCCRTSPELKKSLKVLKRMDDPEEAFEFSSPCGYFNRHSVSRLTTSKTTLDISSEKFSHFGSVDFSRLCAFRSNTNDSVAKAQDNKDSRSVAYSNERSAKCISSKLKNAINDNNSAVVYTNDNGDEKRLQNFNELSHLTEKSRREPDVKAMEFLEWTSNPEKSYQCILKFRQERSNDMDLTLRSRRNHNEQPVVVDDLEDFHHNSLSPEDIVFSAVKDNLKDELENVLNNYKIDLNFYYNSKNLTPLHLAAQLGFAQCIRVLLKHGSNVNCLNSDSHSPLYMAFSGHHFECVVMLIESGADIQQFTAQKLKELEIARKISQTCNRTFVNNK